MFLRPGSVSDMYAIILAYYNIDTNKAQGKATNTITVIYLCHINFWIVCIFQPIPPDTI